MWQGVLLKLGSYSSGDAEFKAGRRSTLKKFPPPTSFFHGLIVCSADPPCPHFLASCVGFLFYLGLSSHEEAHDDRDAARWLIPHPELLLLCPYVLHYLGCGCGNLLVLLPVWVS